MRFARDVKKWDFNTKGRERKLFKIVVRGILFKMSVTYAEWIAAVNELLAE